MSTIILIISIFLFTIWPIKKVATWLGAERNSYGAVIVALLLSFVLLFLAFILAIPLAFLGIPGYIIIVIMFIFAIGTAYSKALITPFWNGVGIAIFATIFGVVLQLLAEMIFSVSLISKGYEGEVSAIVIEDAAEEVCKCGTDSVCMEEKMEIFTQIVRATKAKTFSDKDTQDMQKSAARAFKCMTQAGT